MRRPCLAFAVALLAIVPVPERAGATAPGRAYYLAWPVPGRMTTGFERRVTRGQLATVRAAHARILPGGAGGRSVWAVVPGAHLLGMGASVEFALPSVRTEYYSTDGAVAWRRISSSPCRLPGRSWPRPFSPKPPPTARAARTRRPGTLRCGRPLPAHQRHFPRPARPEPLSRDGTLIGESSLPGSGLFPVPATGGGYRLEIEAGSAGYPLATRVGVAWTFHSGHVEGTAPIPVPFPTFAPDLDLESTAPAGRVHRVPVVVDGARVRIAAYHRRG